MWQKFSEEARKAVHFAQTEAQKSGEVYVSTEHLLLGLLSDPTCVAAQVTGRLGLTIDQIRMEFEKLLSKNNFISNKQMTMTPQAKKVIDFAYDEARLLRTTFIDTDHLLLGILREGRSLASNVLVKRGVRLDQAELEVMAIRGIESRTNTRSRLKKLTFLSLLRYFFQRKPRN